MGKNIAVITDAQCLQNWKLPSTELSSGFPFLSEGGNKAVFRSSNPNVKRVSACNFISKETPVQVFICEFNKILENTCFTEHLRALASNMSFYFSTQISLTFGIMVHITESTLKPKVQSHQKIGSLNDSKLAISVTNFGIHHNICCNL